MHHVISYPNSLDATWYLVQYCSHTITEHDIISPSKHEENRQMSGAILVV